MKLVAATPKWTTLVAVCAKCKHGKDVQKSLRGALKERRERGTRVVRSTCLDVCPKGGTTVSVASSAGLRTTVVRDGIAAAELLDALGER